MKKIVVPVDFSEVSYNTARYAAQLAAHVKYPLVLIHVTDLPIYYGGATLSEDDGQQADQKSLENLANMLREETVGEVEVEIRNPVGSVTYEIAKYANRIDAYAVIIGTHEKSAFARFVLGSVTNGLLKAANCPVIVVPDGYIFKKPERIGLASDLQEVWKTTPSSEIDEIVEDLGGRLEILHVADEEKDRELVMEETKQISSMFAQHRPPVRMLREPGVEVSLLSYSSMKHLDLLILIPKKHSWLEAVTQHQYSRFMAFNATIPVMLVKQPE